MQAVFKRIKLELLDKYTASVIKETRPDLE